MRYEVEIPDTRFCLGCPFLFSRGKNYHCNLSGNSLYVDMDNNNVVKDKDCPWYDDKIGEE